jgi:hypothetical protein
VIDLGGSSSSGAWVVPGLFDTHLHLVSGGFRLAQLDLSAVTSKREFIARVTAAAAGLDAAAGEWLLGGGWDHTAWGGEEPTSEWFADVVDSSGEPGRVLAWLLRADAHTGVASAAALLAAGVTGDTADPPGGVIVRQPPGAEGAGAGGAPTGVLRDNAMALITSTIPPKSEADRVRAYKRAFEHLLSLGVTSVCDFGDIDHLAGSSTEGATERVWKDLAILERLDGLGELPIRISAYLPLADWKRIRDHPTRNEGWFRDRHKGSGGGRGGDREVDDTPHEPSHDSDGYGDSSRLRVAGCKVFLDGSLGAGTALMHAPYSDDPRGTNRGIAVCNLTQFAARVVEADAAGLQVPSHPGPLS